MGSGANGTWKSGSDWDFIVFGSQETLNRLSACSALRRSDLDMLVVYDGNHLQSPWERIDVPGAFKRLTSFGEVEHFEGIAWHSAGLQWEVVSPGNARYVGHKDFKDVAQRAICVWGDQAGRRRLPPRRRDSGEPTPAFLADCLTASCRQG
jgi:hypothetical protein